MADISDKPLRVGIAGLGAVGSELARILLGAHTGLSPSLSVLEELGEQIRLTAICARDAGRDRGFSTEGLTWYEDPVELALSDEIDCFVELIGGEDGIAKEAVIAAIDTGKHVVTANKALMAAYGLELAGRQEAQGGGTDNSNLGQNGTLGMEAAVAGGIPVIRTLQTSLAAAKVTRVAGILNGTCNFILSRMEEAGLNFAAALREAQQLGYAEADPTLDISGVDAAQKLTLLSMLAFGIRPVYTPDDMVVEGITMVGPHDVIAARELGCRIRLLGVAELMGDRLIFGVRPYLVHADHPFAQTKGPGNQIMLSGAPLGELQLIGPGAGGGATAVAVASDIVDIALGRQGSPFGRATSTISSLRVVDPAAHKARFYIRAGGSLSADETGFQLQGFLKEFGISIRNQVELSPRQVASEDQILLTEPVCVKDVAKAAHALRALHHSPENIGSSADSCAIDKRPDPAITILRIADL